MTFNLHQLFSSLIDILLISVFYHQIIFLLKESWHQLKLPDTCQYRFESQSQFSSKELVTRMSKTVKKRKQQTSDEEEDEGESAMENPHRKVRAKETQNSKWLEMKNSTLVRLKEKSQETEISHHH
jgi:hypothetical protein